MREPEGKASREWLSDRGGGEAYGYTGGDGAPWRPVHDEPTPQTVHAWWTGLQFDQAGRLVPFNNNEWSARELAVSDPLYAGVARDYLAALKDKDAADANNLACASIYADPTSADAVKTELSKFKPKTKIIEDNLKLIDERPK